MNFASSLTDMNFASCPTEELRIQSHRYELCVLPHGGSPRIKMEISQNEFLHRFYILLPECDCSFLFLLYDIEVKMREKRKSSHELGRLRQRKKNMTYKEIKKNEEVLAYLKKGNDNLGTMGFTDHSDAHCAMVAERAAMILKKFGYSDHDIELVKIAGFMHDMGNAINRHAHAEYGALLASQILEKTDLPITDRAIIVSAIGNHDESTGGAVDPISAALIIADKTDVRRNRVRQKEMASFDIHDRVNYAVTEAKLKVNEEKKVITLNLKIDENICSMLEYFEIFLQRMLMCRRACEMLGAKFKMTANGSKIV